LRDNIVPQVAPKSPKKAAPKAKSTKVRKAKIADDTLLQRYFDLKESGKVSEHVAETIDLCLAKGSRDVYLPAIRNYLERVES
jgi:hypothetical protein